MRTSIASSPLSYETDVVLARQRAHLIASRLGFERQDQNYIATAVSEIARNAFDYAGGGEVDFSVESDERGQWLLVRISDDGPGIVALEGVLEGTYKSPSGMGIGLRGAKRLMDDCRIETGAGKGTTVELRKKFPAGALQHTRTSLRRIAEEVAKRDTANPLQELRRQSQDLLVAMSELRRRQAEVEALNQELQDTNRGVMALYAELEDRAERLKQADQLKTRFLSHMSHELRTPLNSILALSRMLLDRSDGDLTAEQTKQVEFISGSARSLRTLVDDLLDLAKVEAGKVEVIVGEFSVDQLFGALRGVLRPLLRPGTELIFDLPPDLPNFHTDEAKVSQILRNLVSNAIKFTERGEIRISAAAAGDDWLVFTISDTGVGISPEDQDRIFDEFSQVKNPLQRRAKGTGLGLPISRRLAQLLGGDIEVESAIGAGATFTLTIPRAYAPAGAATLRPYHILIVDDDEAFRYIVRQFLSGANYVIGEAADGLEALQYLKDRNPDVLLVDIAMPVMDGFELLEKIGRLTPAPQSKIIVMTSAVLQPAERRRLTRAVSVLRKDSLSKSVLLSAIARASAVVSR